MPKWICPKCSASYNVSAQHVGKSVKCQKCGTSGVVADSSVDDFSQDQSSPDLYSKLIDSDDSPAKPSRKEKVESTQTTTGLAKGILAAMLAILACFMVFCWTSDSLRPFRELSTTGFFGLSIQMALVWPFYSACDDIHAIRQIANKYR